MGLSDLKVVSLSRTRGRIVVSKAYEVKMSGEKKLWLEQFSPGISRGAGTVLVFPYGCRKCCSDNTACSTRLLLPSQNFLFFNYISSSEIDFQ